MDTVGDFAKQKPLATVAIVAGVGLLLGLLLRRR
ncbi:MAG: glycine zipper domain-containing protein [Pseudomonas sp.]